MVNESGCVAGGAATAFGCPSAGCEEGVAAVTAEEARSRMAVEANLLKHARL
jgi:hypothetical protein